MRMKRHFDPEYMEKHKPRIPKRYQKDPLKRFLGIISPARRQIFYDVDYEINELKWRCYKRKLNRRSWRALITLLKVKGGRIHEVDVD